MSNAEEILFSLFYPPSSQFDPAYYTYIYIDYDIPWLTLKPLYTYSILCLAVGVILSDPPAVEKCFRFTTVPFKPSRMKDLFLFLYRNSCNF